jgi:hypothetical protein
MGARDRKPTSPSVSRKRGRSSCLTNVPFRTSGRQDNVRTCCRRRPGLRSSVTAAAGCRKTRLRMSFRDGRVARRFVAARRITLSGSADTIGALISDKVCPMEHKAGRRERRAVRASSVFGSQFGPPRYPGGCFFRGSTSSPPLPFPPPTRPRAPTRPLRRLDARSPGIARRRPEPSTGPRRAARVRCSDAATRGSGRPPTGPPGRRCPAGPTPAGARVAGTPPPGPPPWSRSRRGGRPPR